jgi:long-subunit acyl-CoA synthetase (AMP-forming)
MPRSPARPPTISCVAGAQSTARAVASRNLAAGNLATADLSALRVCPAGGAPFPVELMQRWQRATGLDIHEAYGMSEITPISGASALTGVRPGSVGKPVPGNEVQIVDLDTGLHVLPPGERGELRVRGPRVMTGYRNQPERPRRPSATASSIRAISATSTRTASWFTPSAIARVDR